ncbi:ABC-type transport system involved in multi-copper enzyme maturation permease subunit [Sporosarcina luteola]|nr:ABC-type transport system involved in multi-copper enzyme maturation permease subunit [Sporosarcina luteola]
MGLLKFELKKIFRQKKLIWLLVAVLLGVGGVFSQNLSKRDTMKERYAEEIRPYSEEVDGLYNFYKDGELKGYLDETMKQQQVHVIDLGTIFFQWKSAIQNEEWETIPAFEQEFLQSVESYEEVDGGFSALYGLDREKAIQKNKWLLEQDLPYVDDEFPLAPALVLKQSADVLLSVGAILFLVLFFGNAMTAEKEQQTWMTLRTQPISRRQRILIKYAGLLFVMVVFLFLVASIGLLIPYLFGEQAWRFDYPQLIQSGEVFSFISTSAYFARSFILFFVAGALVFSFIMLLSTQLKSSFSVLVLTGFIGVVGFSITLMNEGLQGIWNPFHILNISTIVTETVDGSFWLFPVSAIVWSVLILTVALALPEDEKGLLGASDVKKPFDDGRTRRVRVVRNSTLFEWRKLKRQGFLGQSIIILALFAIIGYFLLGQISQKKEAEYIAAVEESLALYGDVMIPDHEKQLDTLEEKKAEAEKSGDEEMMKYYEEVEFHRLKTMLAYNKDVLANYHMGKRAYEQKDWQTYNQFQLYSNRLALGEFNNEYMGRRTGSDSYVSLEASKAEKEWLIKHEIQPIISGSMIPTIYDSWPDKELMKEHVEWNRKVDNNGLFSLYLYFNNFVYFIPMLLLLFVFGAGFAREKGKRPTIQMLQAQPVAMRSIFFGKVTTAVWGGISGLVGIFAFILLFSTILNRLGDWYYPIFHYNSKKVVEAEGYTGMRAFEGGFDFIPLGEYVLSGVVLSICIFLFLVALTQLLGLFMSRTFMVYGCAALLSGIGYVLSDNLGDFAQFSPFIYLDIGRIVNGEVSTVLNNPNVTVLSGCMVLVGVSVLLITAGAVVLRLRVGASKGKKILATTI